MWLLPYFFFFGISWKLGIAQDSRPPEQVHGFCFGERVVLDKVVEFLRPILLPDDHPKLLRQTNCFELALSGPRKNLVETFLRKQYQIDRIYQSQGIPEAETLGHSTRDVYQQCRIDITETTAQQEVNKHMLLLGENMPGHLKVDDRALEIICVSAGGQNKLLTLKVQGPNGELGTSLRVRLGETVNLGQVVRNFIPDQQRSSTEYQLKVQ